MELASANLKRNSYILSYFFMTADEAVKRQTNCKISSFLASYVWSRKFK